jgi:hypothetical protein
MLKSGQGEGAIFVVEHVHGESGMDIEQTDRLGGMHTRL